MTEESETLPPAYANCPCPCHSEFGISHMKPCCTPDELAPEPATPNYDA